MKVMISQTYSGVKSYFALLKRGVMGIFHHVSKIIFTGTVMSFRSDGTAGGSATGRG